MFIYKTFKVLLFSSLLISVFSVRSRKIVSNIDISDTRKKFSGFSIDFRGIDTANGTYWCLLQWSYDLTSLKRTYSEVGGGVGYGGLQTVTDGGKRHGIMSFWQIEYTEGEEKKKLCANRIYPKGNEKYFTGEGDGTNYIADYDWKTNVWYRFALYSWIDSTTKTVFMGQWYQNLETKEWTLYAYFDTKLDSTYLTGPLFQFQENYSSKFFGTESSFQIKNIYAIDKAYDEWVSLNKTRLYYNANAFNGDTAGTHDFGFANTYFYGSSGLPVDDQKAYDESHISSIYGGFNQPDTPPNYEKAKFKSLNAVLTITKLTITWAMDTKTCPCYAYTIFVYQSTTSGYKNIHSYVVTRPEQTKYIYSSSFKGQYKIEVRCNAFIHDYNVVNTVYKTV